MKLVNVLDKLNSFEKNSFIKIIDNIVSANPKNYKEIDKLTSETDKSGLKNLDNVVISRIFDLVEDEFSKLINYEFMNTSSQLDILTDILTKDGNCIIKYDWFSQLYSAKIKVLNKKISILKKELENPKSDISEDRKRDYRIYNSCVSTAFHNDLGKNRDPKITCDELSILITLTRELGLSQEEVKLVNYMVLPVTKLDIDKVVNDLKNIGVAFYSKKTSTIYVADEIVRVLRGIRGKEIADKFLRRALRTLREPQINLICKKHNIDRKLPCDQKIREIIAEGVSFTGLLSGDVHKDGTNVSDKKKYINEFWSKNLNTNTSLKGTTLEEKINNIILYFSDIEKDERVGISIDGYERLLVDLGETLTKLNANIKIEFEMQEDNVLSSTFLLDYNIKPRDVLEIISGKDLEKFCNKYGIKTRGSVVDNILGEYKDYENLYIENYTNIGFRDLRSLNENGLRIKESDLGLKFEDLTKDIFAALGFNVDEKLRKSLNTKKDKIDILLNLGNNNLILIECKTIKESGYNKFSAVSRQMKSYKKLADDKGYRIIKSLLVAPDFSDDFVNDTELEYDLNLSLIKASSLVNILDGFKGSKKHKHFPYKLLMRDVLIDDTRVIRAIKN